MQYGCAAFAAVSNAVVQCNRLRVAMKGGGRKTGSATHTHKYILVEQPPSPANNNSARKRERKNKKSGEHYTNTHTNTQATTFSHWLTRHTQTHTEKGAWKLELALV